MLKIGEKDWDRGLGCEGCGKRPTKCICKENDKKFIIEEIKSSLLFVLISSIVIIACVLIYNSLNN